MKRYIKNMYYCDPFQSIKFVRTRREECSRRISALAKLRKFAEKNFLLSVSRTCTCQKSVTFFLADICLFHQKLAIKYVGRFFCNVGIEGWKIAGWQESQNNIDTL